LPFILGGTGGAEWPGLALISALTAALSAMTKNLALELAPVRVSLIAAGFVAPPLSVAILDGQLGARRDPRNFGHSVDQRLIARHRDYLLHYWAIAQKRWVGFAGNEPGRLRGVERSAVVAKWDVAMAPGALGLWQEIRGLVFWRGPPYRGEPDRRSCF